MRAFIAIDLPEEIRQSLAAISGRLRKSGARASWTRPENIHLTLRFLGDASEETLVALVPGVAAACATAPPLPLAVRGLGAFPNLRKPSVVWVGVETGDDALARLRQEIETAARAVGLPPETRPFRPHLTLARIRDTRALGALPGQIEAARDFEAGAFTAGRVALWSSTLTRHGPIYTLLREFPLA